jgi:TRAP-type C4-dicarboxylate transport system permease small subunit
MKINIGILKHALFWSSFGTALWGTFEQAYNAGASPIWSGTFGFPVPHHYIIGFVGMFIAYMTLTRNEWIVFSKKVKRSFHL